MSCITPLVTALLLLALAPLSGAGEPALGSADFRASVDHPFGWRGDGSGRFVGATPVTEWSAERNVRWGASVGRGYSSPIVAGDWVIVTAEPNLVVCLERANGQVRWRAEVTPADLADAKQREVAQAYVPPKDGSGMAAATPVTDGASVYAVFANGIVWAADLSGKRKWTTLVDAPQNTGYGRSASPIIAGGRLIVHMTNLYAFELAGGAQAWVNTEAKSSYGTPVALKAAGEEVIVTPGGDVVRAGDGKTLASQVAQTAHSSPVVLGDATVCFADGTGVSAMRFDAKFKETEVWNGTVSGEVFGSPLVHAGTVFVVTGAGELFTFDAAATGAQEPAAGEPHKLLEGAAGATPSAYASLTLAGTYLFFNSNKGEIVVMEATRGAKVVARNRLPAGTGSSPVFCGGDMLIRDGERLFCIGTQKDKGKP
jgi:outer membrane protein assembly factor BamB